MVFSSLSFLILFFPVVFACYHLLRNDLRNVFLFAASVFFYSYGGWAATLLFLAEIFLNWGTALLIDRMEGKRAQRKLVLAATIVIDLSILVWFKYASFLGGICSSVTGLKISLPQMALPVGISFYTFQTLSYVIDVYRGEKAQRDPICVGLYIAFFPQLIAGPIVRYRDIRPYLLDRQVTFTDISEGMIRFGRGFCKKVLLANQLAVAAEYAFSPAFAGSRPFPVLWVGAIAYALQLFFDFSGYSDMAIGLGRMFGFRLPQNFDTPYLAKTGTDFWRRWHISLSAWFRDYVYIPLGGSRNGTGVTIRNLLVVWTLTGVWHGAGWNFLLWGILWGLLLIAEKFWLCPEKRGVCFQTVYRGFVLLFILAMWILFRSDNLEMAGIYLKGMLHGSSIPLGQLRGYVWWFQDTLFYVAAGLLVAFCLPQRIFRRIAGWIDIPESVSSAFCLILLLAGTLLAFSYTASGGYNPFLYFQF